MEVCRKDKYFFKNQTQQENQELFVEWQLTKNRIRIAGLKEDVNTKLKQIIDFMNVAAPKYVFLALTTFSLLIFALKLFGLMHYWVIFGLININNIINIVAVAFDYSYG